MSKELKKYEIEDKTRENSRKYKIGGEGGSPTIALSNWYLRY